MLSYIHASQFGANHIGLPVDHVDSGFVVTEDGRVIDLDVQL
jgi:hypothetical protein